jgi:DNA-binding CsgD family transcriptional regulator
LGDASNVLISLKDNVLRFADFGEFWLQSVNCNNEDKRSDLKEDLFVRMKFTEQHRLDYEQDILSGREYGFLHPATHKSNKNALHWIYDYKWPSRDDKGNINGINTIAAVIKNRGLIDSFFWLAKNQSASNKGCINSSVSENKLTDGEKRVLFYLCRELPAKKIAHFLNISYRTVELHIERIKRKLKCFTKAQVVEYAVNKGYVSATPMGLAEGCVLKGGVQAGLHQFLSEVLLV